MDLVGSEGGPECRDCKLGYNGNMGNNGNTGYRGYSYILKLKADIMHWVERIVKESYLFHLLLETQISIRPTHITGVEVENFNWV